MLLLKGGLPFQMEVGHCLHGTELKRSTRGKVTRLGGKGGERSRRGVGSARRPETADCLFRSLLGQINDFGRANGCDELREDVEARALNPAGRVDHERGVGIRTSLILGEEVEDTFNKVSRVQSRGDRRDSVGPHLAF